jgi:23S rRNA (pseudouridine1915-N3)-methyltransferase
MKISCLAIGSRMPDWVDKGVQEYARRIRQSLGFSVVEIPMPRRVKSVSIARCMAQEGQAMLDRIGSADYVVALDVGGKQVDTAGLAGKLEDWQSLGRDIVLLIGGPDGLSEDCLSRADARWSLSALTLPHPLVRIVLVEQLYRAHSLLQGHPYHRE